MHASCGDVDNLTAGIVKPAGTLRVPEGTSYHRHTKMLNDGHVMSDALATAITCDLLAIVEQTDLFLKDAMPWA